MTTNAWDTRYSEPGYAYGTEPNDFLVREAARIQGGDVLCLADGEGRNAVYLAGRGCRVTAVDVSRVGLDKGQALARTRGVSLTSVHEDLARYEMGEVRWDAVVSIFCHLPSVLRRDVFRRVTRALRPGGVLLLEAYAPSQIGRGTGGPSDPDLLAGLADWTEHLRGLDLVLAHEVERDVHEGRFHRGASVVVQIVAERPTA